MDKTKIAGRGFAGMDPERQRDIARQGGTAAHRVGHAHQWTPEQARAAALKGHANRKAREHQAAIQAAGAQLATFTDPSKTEE